MKTPIVHVMRTQGARRRHQQAVESNNLQKYLDEQRQWLAKINEEMRKEQIEYSRLLSRLSDRFSKM